MDSRIYLHHTNTPHEQRDFFGFGLLRQHRHGSEEDNGVLLFKKYEMEQ
ncbi:MAG TPA: hypothetical protein VFJ51_13295 [Nitrososphaeraceae archaeon]|nr:hypothetical protein [Nitrososphaeraceae archaeon]